MSGFDKIERMTQAISRDTVVVRRPGISATEIDGETLMFVIELGKFFAIQGSGTRVWELLATPVAVSELVERLVAEFDVDPGVCEEQTIRLLERMVESGLAGVEPR